MLIGRTKGWSLGCHRRSKPRQSQSYGAIGMKRRVGRYLRHQTEAEFFSSPGNAFYRGGRKNRSVAMRAQPRARLRFSPIAATATSDGARRPPRG